MKTLNFIGVILIAFLAVGCVDNEIDSALENKDFQKAHDIIRNDDMDLTSSWSCSDVHKVYQQELEYLISQNTDASWFQAYEILEHLPYELNDFAGQVRYYYPYRLQLYQTLMGYAIPYENWETARKVASKMDKIVLEMMSNPKYQGKEYYYSGGEHYYHDDIDNYCSMAESIKDKYIIALKESLDRAIERDKEHDVEKLVADYFLYVDDIEKVELERIREYFVEKKNDNMVAKIDKRLDVVKKLSQPIPITLTTTAVQGGVGSHFQVVKNPKGYALVKEGDEYKLSVSIKRIKKSTDEEYSDFYGKVQFHLMGGDGQILQTIISETTSGYSSRYDFGDLKKGSSAVFTAQAKIDKKILLAVKQFEVEIIK